MSDANSNPRYDTCAPTRHPAADALPAPASRCAGHGACRGTAGRLPGSKSSCLRSAAAERPLAAAAGQRSYASMQLRAQLPPCARGSHPVVSRPLLLFPQDFNLSRILEDTTQGSSMAAMNPVSTQMHLPIGWRVWRTRVAPYLACWSGVLSPFAHPPSPHCTCSAGWHRK